MKSCEKWLLVTSVVLLCLCSLIACKKQPISDSEALDEGSGEAADKFTRDEVAAGAKLKPAKDPIQEEIYAFRLKTRQAYNSRRFDQLEIEASRAAKPLFGNGSWQIVQFYQSFECRDDEPENMWQLHDRIHQDWIAAKQGSVTARVAYADFLTDYAWRARGSGFAKTVTKKGWRLFHERLASARKVLGEARRLPEKDPVWWLVALRVALGEGWPRVEYDALLAEATSFEPKFWGYHTARAYSLLPRWYGKPGDWEAYASEAAAHPNGLGAEIYARIVINLRAYFKNIFHQSQASWLNTRQGLEQMRQKYPNSLEIVSATAMLASLAEDRVLAKQMFDRLGDTYLPGVWGKPERFIHYQKWALSQPGNEVGEYKL